MVAVSAAVGGSIGIFASARSLLAILACGRSPTLAFANSGSERLLRAA